MGSSMIKLSDVIKFVRQCTEYETPCESISGGFVLQIEIPDSDLRHEYTLSLDTISDKLSGGVSHERILVDVIDEIHDRTCTQCRDVCSEVFPAYWDENDLSCTDCNADYVDHMQEMKDPYAYRGLSRSEFY